MDGNCAALIHPTAEVPEEDTHALEREAAALAEIARLRRLLEGKADA